MEDAVQLLALYPLNQCAKTSTSFLSRYAETVLQNAPFETLLHLEKEQCLEHKFAPRRVQIYEIQLFAVGY